MSINKNPQSAYETLQNLLTDPMKRRVFGQGGLFGYRKEDHQVLELFAEYSCNEIYNNRGVAPLTMDSESFIRYLNSQEKLSESRKLEIAKDIRFLKDQREIVDYPIEKNTLRNFAELLYELDIGRQPEKITVRYELALEKALSLKPLIEGTTIENEKEKAEKSETPNLTPEQKSDEMASTGYSGGGYASSENNTTAARETESAVEANVEEKSEREANARIDIKSKTETSTFDESEKAEKSKEASQEAKITESQTETKPEPEAEPKEDSELGEPLTSKPAGQISKITPEEPETILEEQSKEKLKEKPHARAQKHLIIKVQTPVYQRLNLPKKSSRRISPIESRLGNLRKAEKTENKGNQSRVQQQSSITPQEEQSQMQASQNPYKNIPIIPVRQKSKKKSLAKGLVKLAGAGVGSGMILPFLAGSSSANAATFATSHLEKILKFLF